MQKLQNYVLPKIILITLPLLVLGYFDVFDYFVVASDAVSRAACHAEDKSCLREWIAALSGWAAACVGSIALIITALHLKETRTYNKLHYIQRYIDSAEFLNNIEVQGRAIKFILNDLKFHTENVDKLKDPQVRRNALGSLQELRAKFSHDVFMKADVSPGPLFRSRGVKIEFKSIDYIIKAIELSLSPNEPSNHAQITYGIRSVIDSTEKYMGRLNTTVEGIHDLYRQIYESP